MPHEIEMSEEQAKNYLEGHTFANVTLDAVRRTLQSLADKDERIDKLQKAMKEALTIFENRELYVMMGPRGALQGAEILREALSTSCGKEDDNGHG